LIIGFTKLTIKPRYEKPSLLSEWQNIVEKNVDNLAKDNTTFCWPRDSLFRYYLMMEALQENLEERLQLLHLACEYSTNTYSRRAVGGRCVGTLLVSNKVIFLKDRTL